MNCTISVMCMCCNWRLSLSGDSGTDLEADLDKMRLERGWVRLPPRDDPKRPYPVDVCSACIAEIRTR
jgi:hypothetical protein